MTCFRILPSLRCCPNKPSSAYLQDDYKKLYSAPLKTEDDVFRVLNHGDAWINNLLFSYDDDKRPDDVLFVSKETTSLLTVSPFNWFPKLHRWTIKSLFTHRPASIWATSSLCRSTLRHEQVENNIFWTSTGPPSTTSCTTCATIRRSYWLTNYCRKHSTRRKCTDSWCRWLCCRSCCARTVCKTKRDWTRARTKRRGQRSASGSSETKNIYEF